MNEEEIHQALIKYFVTVHEGEPDTTYEGDGKTAFVVVAFNKPTDPAQFVSRTDGAPTTRGERATAVTTVLAQICPAVGVSAVDGKVEPAAILSEGVHALCASVLAKFMSEVALQQVVSQARLVMAKREELLNA